MTKRRSSSWQASFLKFFLVLAPLIATMATIQQTVVMGIPLTPMFYVVPLVASVVIAFLAAKVQQLSIEAEAAKWRASLLESKRLSTLGLLSSNTAQDLHHVIQGIKLALADDEAGDLLPHIHQRISDSLTTGEKLLGELILLTKSDDQEQEIFNLTDLLIQIRDSMLRLASGRAEVICHWPANTPITVQASKQQLYYVLVNLVINAIRATTGVRDANIAMLVELQAGAVKICIEDNGPGLTQAMMEKLFKLPTNAGSSGSGTSLYISQRIIESYNGIITYEDNDRGGATFSVFLPLASQE